MRAVLRTLEASAPSEDTLPYNGQSLDQQKRCGECLTALDMNIPDMVRHKKAIKNATRVSFLCEMCGNAKCKKHLI
jgi:hypothetical protein